ncbi:MAG: flavodoxin [Candidatus Omnitrophota bacterium]
MNTLITYYSFSGNTEKVANIFAGKLKVKGEVVVQRLKPVDEITSFGAQCRAAFTKKRAELAPGIDFDSSPFELVVLASPIWAFAPVPAMNSYLDKVNGLHGKRVIIVLTSGSGLGVGKCFKNIRQMLQGKGASSIDEINIPDRKQGDMGFIEGAVAKYL